MQLTRATALGLDGHPEVFLALSSGVSAFFALNTTPSFIPLVALLTSLQVYLRQIINRPYAVPKSLALWFITTAAIVFAHAGPMSSALSTPGVALTAVSGLTALTTALAMFVVFIDIKLCMRTPGPWANLTLFPALWSTAWLGIAHSSPIGYLATWSPVLGIDAYRWLRPYTGVVGINWITAAWSVVLAQVIQQWYMGTLTIGGAETQVEELERARLIDHDDDEIISHEHERENGPRSQKIPRSTHVAGLAILLLLLTAPSFLVNSLPLPVSSVTTTPISVACILPSTVYPDKKANTDIDRFIDASKQTNGASILVWPEGAVRFENASIRDDVFKNIIDKSGITSKLVAVSYEEPIEADTPGKRRKYRTAVSLIDHRKGVVDTYFKRNLVPIAESFNLASSNEPPSLYEVEIGVGNSNHKINRNITVTTSICLDFASPEPFADLESRPSLILAPARTWHPDIGRAMWEQAKARAEESGTMVVWCDGGEGGLSGVGGRGFEDPVQVGEGTWIKTVAIEWPSESTRTVYARVGGFSVLVLLWLVSQFSTLALLPAHLPLPAALRRASRLPHAVIGLRQWVRGLVTGQRRTERQETADERSLLLDH